MLRSGERPCAGLIDPWDYQRYIQGFVGRVQLRQAFLRASASIGDRTLCYLASGKSAVVQHTDPSQILPNVAGLFHLGYNQPLLTSKR
jgi:hypothetical protein